MPISSVPPYQQACYQTVWLFPTFLSRFCPVCLVSACSTAESGTASCPDKGVSAGAGGGAAERAGHAAAAGRRRHVPAGAPSMPGCTVSAQRVKPVEVCMDQASVTGQQQQQ